MKELNIYIIAGQSNALGMANDPPADMPREYTNTWIYQEGGAVDSNVFIYGKLLKTRMGMGHTRAMFGLEMGMADVLSQTGTVGFIKCAYASTGLFDFWKAPYADDTTEGYGFPTLISAVQNGLAAYTAQDYIPKIVGMAWMQGESDADKTAEIADAYTVNLTRFFDAVKSQLSLPDLKIVLGEIYPHSTLLPYKDRVITQQYAFAQSYPNTSIIATGDLPVNPIDAYHWYGREEFLLGQRFAQALL